MSLLKLDIIITRTDSLGIQCNGTGNGTNVEKEVHFDFVKTPISGVATCDGNTIVSLGDRTINKTIDGQVFIDLDSGSGSHQAESNKRSHYFVFHNLVCLFVCCLG